jgi:4-carboxymuconolactone decarboxylase
MALGQLPLLKRHIERGLNLGLTPEEVVEVFIQLTFYVGVPAVETAMRIAKEIFEEQSIQFSPNQVYDTNQTVESLYELGLSTHREHMGDNFEYQNNDPDSEESQLERLITEYHWGAIYNRPILSAKDRAMCALSAMTVMGRYDRQIRNRIVGALRVGMTPAEIMEVFIQMTLYGGYLTTRTAMRIARSVFTEQGISS